MVYVIELWNPQTSAFEPMRRTNGTVLVLPDSTTAYLMLDQVKLLGRVRPTTRKREKDAAGKR